MIVPYLPELFAKQFEWTEALVRVAFTQIDNALCFWLPADNKDLDSTVVFEPSVKFAHKRFALR
jgi:hypothetical protein